MSADLYVVTSQHPEQPAEHIVWSCVDRALPAGTLESIDLPWRRGLVLSSAVADLWFRRDEAEALQGALLQRGLSCRLLPVVDPIVPELLQAVLGTRNTTCSLGAVDGLPFTVFGVCCRLGVEAVAHAT